MCNQCFQQLVKRFAEFVQAKVGESSGLPAHEVSLDEYLITFNCETYNLEADPKERSYVQEIVSSIVYVFLFFVFFYVYIYVEDKSYISLS